MGPQLASHGTYKEETWFEISFRTRDSHVNGRGSARALPLDLSLRVGFCRQSRFFIGSARLVCASLNVALRGLDRFPVSVSLRPLVSVCDFIYLVDVAVKEMMQGRGSSGALARVS